MDETQKRVLIVGATSGIGQAVALRFAEAGQALVLHGRDEAKLDGIRMQVQGAEKHAVHTLIGDVVAWSEDPKGIPDMEPVDVVVWCPGICELAAGQMLKLKALRRTFAVNLESPLVVVSHLFRTGRIREGGKVIFIGSESAREAGEGFSIYAASKGGLASAARVLDKEFQRKGVRVHCLEPGTVDTPMTRKLAKMFPAMKQLKQLSPDDVAREVLEMVTTANGHE